MERRVASVIAGAVGEEAVPGRKNQLAGVGIVGHEEPATGGLAGEELPGGWPVPTWRPGACIGMAVLVPLLIADFWIHSWRFSAETGWLLLVVLETGALLTLPTLVWGEVIRATSKIDDLLEDGDNAKVANWLDRKLVPGGHLGCCLLGVGVAVGGSVLAGQYVEPSFTAAYFIAIGVLGFLSVDVVRWAWRAPLVLRHIAAGCPNLRINKLAPADTQSVRQMSDLVTTASLYAAVGIAIFAAPLVWMVIDSSKHRFELAGWSGPPMLLALATATYLTFLPDTWITRMLEQRQLQVLEAIAWRPFIDGEVASPSEQLDREVALYQTFAAGATATPEARALSRKAAKVLLAVTPYAAAVVVKLLHLKVG